MGIPEAPATVSSTDVADHLACRHKATLALAEPPSAAAAGPTLAAMASGAELIAPATLETTTATASVDALRRVPQPSDLGSWSYEPHDTVLSRTDPTRALIMLADAALQLQTLQDRLPDNVHLLSAQGLGRAVPMRDLEAFARRARARAEAFAADPPPTVARPCDHCRRCPWQSRCRTEWEERDDVALVAGAFGRVVEQLAGQGIETATQLAHAPDDPPPGIDARRFRTLRRQARLQVAACSGPDRYEVLPPDEHRTGGFSLLPAPDAGDLFFDLEGDPHQGNGGLEYLWGISDVDNHYRSWWGHSPTDERAAFETVMDLLTDHLEAHPRAHVFHYAAYETEVLRRLALRHASREDQLQRMTDDRRFVDLYRVVRQTVATSRPGYGMKQLEHFYRPERETDVQDGLASVLAYESWLAEGDQALLDDIEAYNRDDCISTRQLRDWLEERRIETAGAHGPPEDPTRSQVSNAITLPPRSDRAERLAQRLRDELPDALDQRNDTHRRDDLLLQLLEWHRREDRRRPAPEPTDEAKAASAPTDTEATVRAEAVVATVEAVVSDAPEGRAFDAVLRRTAPAPPGVLRPLDGETAADVVVRAACAIDHGALAVQAPPGTGLTSTINRLVAALTTAGRAVGLCGVDQVAEGIVAEVARAHPEVVAGPIATFAATE
ncbi:MAG: TM0106 family RecB-like putative nuclease, partial [Acidimicrobiales bacterium]